MRRNNEHHQDNNESQFKNYFFSYCVNFYVFRTILYRSIQEQSDEVDGSVFVHGIIVLSRCAGLFLYSLRKTQILFQPIIEPR